MTQQLDPTMKENAIRSLKNEIKWLDESFAEFMTCIELELVETYKNHANIINGHIASARHQLALLECYENNDSEGYDKAQIDEINRLRALEN